MRILDGVPEIKINPQHNHFKCILNMWAPYKKGFKAWLQLERSLSDNSVEAYLRDIEKFTEFLQLTGTLKVPDNIELNDLQQFVKWIGDLEMTASSQARIISGLRSFYKYCLIENIT